MSHFTKRCNSVLITFPVSSGISSCSNTKCTVRVRYQPDAGFEKSRINEGKEDVGESELTESESHLNMLKDRGVTLRSLLNPPLLPTEQTSSAVNASVIIMG